MQGTVPFKHIHALFLFVMSFETEKSNKKLPLWKRMPIRTMGNPKRLKNEQVTLKVLCPDQTAQKNSPTSASCFHLLFAQTLAGRSYI
jgi:hypothetical protein